MGWDGMMDCRVVHDDGKIRELHLCFGGVWERQAERGRKKHKGMDIWNLERVS